MLFKDIVGQQAIKKRLIQSVKDERISHAQLFHGNEGTGKLALALAYARYICCENPTAEDSCGTCTSCNKYNKYIHPDLHFVFPVVKAPTGKSISDNHVKEWREMLTRSPYFSEQQWYRKISAENKQGSIFTDEAEEIIRKLNLKTFETDYKIMIIWLPEKMNLSSANKLLKVIEEPPPFTLIILVSENASQILPTIYSRSQPIRVPSIQPGEIKKYFHQLGTVSPDKIEEIAKLCKGNLVSAMELIDANEQNQENFNFFSNWMRFCYQAKIIELVELTEEMAKWGREKIKNFLGYSLRMMRENFILNYQQQDLVYLEKTESNFSVKFSPFVHEENIAKIARELNKAMYHIEANGSEKIVLLDLSIQLIRLIKPVKK
jgi:DNA polymerase-3 subunit delta'